MARYFTRWQTRQATWRYSSRPRTARSLIASSAHGPQTRWSAWQSTQYIRREADSPRPQKAHSPSMARGCTSPSALPCLLMVAGWLCRRSTCARGWCDSQRRPYCWAQDLHRCPSESPTNFRRQALAAVWSLRRLPSLHGLRPRPSSLPMRWCDGLRARVKNFALAKLVGRKGRALPFGLKILGFAQTRWSRWAPPRLRIEKNLGSAQPNWCQTGAFCPSR